MMRFFLTLVLLNVVTILTGLDSLPPPVEPPVPGTLQFSVDNVRDAQGTLWVGIYHSDDDFLDREKARLVSVKVNREGRAVVKIPDMVQGQEYALGIFHDVNDNGEFDTNFFGLPTEPWAFSGTLRSRLRVPRFKEVSFVFDERIKLPILRLRTWF